MSFRDNGTGSAIASPGLEFELTQTRRGKTRIKVRFEGELIHCDTIDIERAASRRELAGAVVEIVGDELAVRDVERALLAEVEALGKTEEGPDSALGGPIESVDDPDRLARLYLESDCQGPDGPTLRSYKGAWYLWDGVAYRELPEGELDAALVPRFKSEFDRFSVETRDAAPKVTRQLLANVRLALQSRLIIPGSRGMPCWIEDGHWPVGEVLAARNGLFHLPALAEGATRQVPPTPSFFSTFALDYLIEVKPETPGAWLAFLEQVFPNDPQSVAALQEFMGYTLTHDTSLQKMLLIVGPPRSGKGTMGRVMTGLVGEWNVAGPTAASLKSNFGCQELLGKPLAILADAQLKRHDDALVERLKSISGEDLITVDRKYADPITVRLPTRLVIMTNDLPRFRDPSGALANRMIILRLTESFLGREDPALGSKLLGERAGILMWAVAGWKHLRMRGRFMQPASGLPLLQELQDLSSQIGQFVRECCRIGDSGLWTPRQKLYGAYQRWCVAKGFDHPLSASSFGVNLRSVVPNLGDAHPTIDGKRVWCYTGIALQE